MFLFRHVLLCTIACVSVATEGHVLFAVNVEDFKNLANQFLSRNVAQKLTSLVSAGANRRDDSNSDLVSGIDLNKIAELIRDRILIQHKTTVTSTKNTRKSNINKRFNTVQNTADTTEPQKTTKRILRDPNYKKTEPGLIYVKDDVETLFQNYNEQPNTYDTTKHVYYETRSSESDEDIGSQEPRSTKASMDVKEHTEHQNDTHKKMDNTEAKLGEWLYNHIIAEKPTKLQNHKTGNMDINDVENADEFPDEQEHIRNVQYVYSLSEQDKSKQNNGNVAELQNDRDTNNFNLQTQQTNANYNDYIVGPKLNSIYKNKPQKRKEENKKIENDVMRDYVEPIPGNKNPFNQENIVLAQDQQADEQGTINESIMRPTLNTIYKKKPQKQQIEENYMISQSKDQEIQNLSSDDRPEYVKTILENKNTFNNKKNYLDEGAGRMSASLEESKPGPIKSKIENLLSDAEEGKQQPIEKHIMYDKYGLGSKDKENNQEDPQRQSVRDNYELGQTKSRNNNRVDPQEVDNSDETLMLEIENVFHENQDEAGDHSIPDTKKTTNHLPLGHNDVKSDSDKSKIESTLQDTVEVNIQENVKRIATKENNIQLKRPRKHSIEENDEHETYSLSSETKNKKYISIKPLPDDDYVSKKESKHRYDDVSDNDDEFANKSMKGSSVAVAKNKLTKKAPMHKEKIVDDLPLGFESAKLGSSSNEIEEKPVEEHKTADKYKLGNHKETTKKQVTEEDDKYDNKRPQKHSIEENNTHGRYKLSSETKNKKDDNNDDKSNKYRHKDISEKQAMEEDDKYDNESNKYKHKETFEKQATAEDDKYYNKYKHKETSKKQATEEVDTYDNKFNKYKHKETSKKQATEKDDEYDNKFNKYKHKETSKKQATEKDDEYDNKFNKYKHKETFNKQATEEDDKYDNKFNKYKHKETSNKQAMEEDDRYDNKFNKYKHKETSNKQAMEEDDRYDNKFNKYKQKDSSKKQATEENETYEKYSPDRKGKDKANLKKQPIEENSMYEIYELGSKHKSKDREFNKNYDNGYEETAVGKKNEGNHGRDIKDADNNDELILKNKNRHILKATKQGKGQRHEEVPLEGFADDPRPDFKEVKPEHIKAKTYRIQDSDERKGKPTKRFKMKGTLIPKREFYKLSSPNYYKDLPRNVEKYDFGEPVPERDRERDKVRYLKREPARVNRKVKLPKFERVT